MCKRFGGVVATDDLWLSVKAGEVHAVIGPNGAGKTTLIAQLAGVLHADSGVIILDNENISNLSAPARAQRGLARSFQVSSIFKTFSCLENVSLAVQAHHGHSFRFWRSAANDTKLFKPALHVLTNLGLEARATEQAGNLAHGEKRLLELAMCLATSPKLLLLDEPMAGMSKEDSLRTIEHLRSIKGQYTMLLVEHDMDAVFALADRITVLVYGRAIATGTVEEIRANPQVRQAYLGGC